MPSDWDADDQEALLLPIRREPDADAPRLHYADWLQRSPHAADQARAEFIRLQIDLARATNEHPHWPTMIGRQRELLQQHRTTWERSLRRRCQSKWHASTRWLKARFFSTGGVWGYRRGFVEQVLAPVERFLQEDHALLNHLPIRRVALTHASEFVEPLVKAPMLDGLDSLHLVGDMELDEDLQFLSAAARRAGLVVLEFRLPRLRDVFVDSIDEDPTHDRHGLHRDRAKWLSMGSHAKNRLNAILQRPADRLLFDEPSPEQTATVLALTEWVFLGDRIKEAGVWGVAKSFHDTPDEEGRCRRLLLFRERPTDEWFNSPYFHVELR